MAAAALAKSLSFVMTGLPVALLAAMVYRELRDAIRENDPRVTLEEPVRGRANFSGMPG